MAIEAGAIFALFTMMGPKASQAETAHVELTTDASHELVEIKIAEDKYQNLQQGKVWYWDLGVVVQVKEKHAEQVEGALEKRAAEIQEGISQIVGRAQPAQLKEPDRQTLQRQFTAFLVKIFGSDDDGHPLVERVLIPKCRGIPGEF